MSKEARIKCIQLLRAQGKTWDECYVEFNIIYPEVHKSARALERWYQKENVRLDQQLEVPVDALKAQRRSQVNALKKNRQNRELLDNANLLDDILLEIKKTLNQAPLEIKKYNVRKNKKGKPMTCEALLGDLQIGKITPDFNVEIAKKRLDRYGKSLIFKLDQHMKNGYTVDRIVLALLGDIIESLDKAARKDLLYL